MMKDESNGVAEANSFLGSMETDHSSPTKSSNDQIDDDQEQSLTFAGDSIRNVIFDIPSSPPQTKESKDRIDIPNDDPSNIKEEQDATALSTSHQPPPSEEEIQNISPQLQKEHSSSSFPLPLSLQRSLPNDHERNTPNSEHFHEEFIVSSEETTAESVVSEIPESSIDTAAATTPMPVSPTVYQKSRTSTPSSPPIMIMLAPVLRKGTTSPPPSNETLVPSDEDDNVDGGSDTVRTMEFHDIRATNAMVSNDLEVGDVNIAGKYKPPVMEETDEERYFRQFVMERSQGGDFSRSAMPKDSLSSDNEDTTTTYPPHLGDYQETLTDVNADDDDDDDDNNKMDRKLSPIPLKLWLLLGCCVGTLLLVGGSAGVATYMLVDPPTEAPTISPAPTISGMPSFVPSSSPTRVHSDSPSLPPTSTMQPSARPSVSPSLEPSSMPSSSPTPDFHSVLEGFLWREYAVDASSGGPFEMAADWIVREQVQSGSDRMELSNELVQRFALVALELSLDDDGDVNENISTRRQGNNVTTRMAILQQSECEWPGISCNDRGQVIRVKWARKDWKGQIPEVIRLLFHLKELDLSDNDIGGTIPESLYSLASLERLYLYKNSIGGTISSRIGQLNKLTHWHLSHNQLNGSIPEQLKSSEGIRPLQYFNVYLNQLTGRIPDKLRLRFLRYLDVGRNQLTGRLPKDIGESFVELRHLHLDHNSFGGTVPSSYNMVGNGRLESLTLHHNRFTGTLSGERPYYNKLQLLTVHENKFDAIASENCDMIIPKGEMPEFKADCDICKCDDYFNLCNRFCGSVGDD